jgi:hypothetical protein
MKGKTLPKKLKDLRVKHKPRKSKPAWETKVSDLGLIDPVEKPALRVEVDGNIYSYSFMEWDQAEKIHAWLGQWLVRYRRWK